MASFTINQPGFHAMANGPEVTRVVEEVANKGARYAETIAPKRTGHYASSFQVSVRPQNVGRFVRPVARIENTVEYAAALEWGNSRTRGRFRRVLGRTLAALGGL